MLPLTPPNPATVVTVQLVPDDVALRKVWLPESTTYRLPELSTLIPTGPEKSALVPVPSALPHIPARRAGGGRGIVVLLLLAVAGIAVYVLLDGFLQPR